MSRIPLIDADQMDPEVRQIYESVGPLKIFRLLAQTPALVKAMNPLGVAIMTESSIAPIDRELLILVGLHIARGSYEWVQHVAIARKLGMPEAWIEEIAGNRLSSAKFSDREKALISFAQQIALGAHVDDLTFNAVSTAG